MRNALVVAELALSLVLLTGAGLLMQTLWRLEHIDTGLVTEQVLTADVLLSYKQYPAARRDAFFADVLERVSSLPGVVAAGAAAGLPPHMTMTSPLTVEGAPAPAEPGPADQVSFKDVLPGYFEALRIPLRAGRFFTEQDRQVPDVAIVNEALVRHFFAGQDPIGKRISSGRFDRARTIIGIAGDVKNRGVQDSAQPELYRLDADGNLAALVIRTSGDPIALASLVREQARALDRNALLNFRTMTEQMDNEFTSQRFNSILLSAFAGIALLLAAIGVYGVMSYLVSLRRREMGIRMALGARASQVVGLVIGHAFRLIMAGVVAGLSLAMILTRYLKTLLYGVTSTDALTLGMVAILLAAVAFLASDFPARRASRIDPSAALRCE